MMRKISILSLTAFLMMCHLPMFAQIEWECDTLDFGTFREEQGTVEGTVKFRNVGDDITYIARVRTSCGCTGVDYSQEAIKPNEYGEIKIKYDPKGRPGRFEKTVKIYLGDSRELKTIPIRGMVIGAPESLFQKYPYQIGPLRLSSLSLNAGEVPFGEKHYLTLLSYNVSDSILHPRIDVPKDSPISIVFSNDSVAPGEVLTLSIMLDTREAAHLSDEIFTFDFYPNADATSDKIKIEVAASIIPNIHGKSNREILESGRAEISPEYIDIGKIKGDKKIKADFNIANIGKSELQISRVTSKSEAIRILRFPGKISAGKDSSIQIELNPTLVSDGPFRIAIRIISNDLMHPLQEVYLTGIKTNK